jgi:cytochrome c-type biogenesis protein CcmE
VVVIGAAVVYLLHLATKSSWAYYCSVDEFVQSKFAGTSQNGSDETSRINKNYVIRLAGRVKDGSVVRNAEKMQLDFVLAGQKNSLPVRFYGMVPKNFEAGKEVIVEGKVDTGGVFLANKILTRCESKYKVKLQTKPSD